MKHTAVRLDHELVRRGLARSRSQAHNLIKLGKVLVAGRPASKAGQPVDPQAPLRLLGGQPYVSRAGLKLASVADRLSVDFINSVVLDVGSSTGGFTEYALRHGARLVYAVDVGTDQLHPSLRGDQRIRLHEHTDIRDFTLATNDPAPTIVVIDVSFISLQDILPSVRGLVTTDTIVLAMVKPQFEAGRQHRHHGVIKNDRMRRQILQEFEQWARGWFVIEDKADSHVPGAKGNRERFYRLRPLPRVGGAQPGNRLPDNR